MHVVAPVQRVGVLLVLKCIVVHARGSGKMRASLAYAVQHAEQSA
jgi:hypothetical protein